MSENGENNRLALVLAGGGITGAVYELGCLRALDDAFGETGSVNDFDIYIGVSAGAAVASFLANGVRPEEAVDAIIEGTPDLLNFQREDVYRPDYRFLFRSLWGSLRALTLFPFQKGASRGKTSRASLFDLLEEELPSGIFRLDPLEGYLREVLSMKGRCNDFRQLRCELYIPATELDTGERWVFGDESLNSVPISKAVAASCSIPIFFRPYRIGDHDFVDGAVGRVGHIDIALERGATSILVINPMVPIYNDRSRLCIPTSTGECARISERGFVSVFNQAARIGLTEKLHLGMGYLQAKHPNAKIILHEPSRNEAPMFLKNPMSFAARAELIDYGYVSMRERLRNDWDRFQDFFAGHGIDLQEEGVWGPKGRPTPSPPKTAARSRSGSDET